MKITHSVFRYYPALGGVEDYLKRISEGMAHRGHEISIYTSNLINPGGKELVLSREELVNNVKIKRFGAFPLKLKDYSFFPSLMFELLKSKPDIIHGHSFMHFSGDSSVVASKIKGIPFVFNPYVVTSDRHSFMGLLYRKTLGRVALSADVVIAISNFEKEVIKKISGNVHRMEVIPPGLDLGEFKNGQSNIFKKYGIENKKVILFVGRIAKSKDIDLLIKAMPDILKNIPEAFLLIIGPDFGQRSCLKALCLKEKIKDYVLFTGSLDRSDLLSAYKHADIFAFPGTNEAFGVVLIEAMAAGLPVVVADACAAGEIIKDGFNGSLFPPKNFKALSEKICGILLNEKKRVTMGENSFSIVKNKYDIEDTIKAITEVYYSLRK